jgi:polyphosphate kinase
MPVSPVESGATLRCGAGGVRLTPMDIDGLDPSHPQLYINRELSWLAFNERVLEEARDPTLPLFERLKFLGIVTTNLDEFFMVRIAGLKRQILAGVTETPADGMLPAEQDAACSVRAHALLGEQDRIWNETLLPELKAAGVHVVGRDAMTPEQREFGRQFFVDKVFPALTPLAVDPGHPFPHLRNKSLNLAVLLARGTRRRKTQVSETSFAVVQVPGIFPRLVSLPVNGGLACLLLEDLIADNVAELFPGFRVLQTNCFRVTRNWDLLIDEEESEDLLFTVEEELRRRDRGAAVRLEIDAAASSEMAELLRSALHLGAGDVYRLGAPLQINDLVTLSKVDARPELRLDPHLPVTPRAIREAESMFDVIHRGDVLLHHPYESFEPVMRFLEDAADDPQVLAIKQTLYRTSADRPIVRALCRAAENRKQVAVLVEIKARFDEENNIAWARRLEESGVHVVYGLLGLKTHCKVAMVVRNEGTGIRRYVHLGTGNYNLDTARQYTDLSLFTARPEIADDASALFNLLTGYSSAPKWKRLTLAPFDLQNTLVSLIGREAERVRQGGSGRILAKMNSLVDPTVIRALYEASRAGVEIALNVRGICCLRPGVPGVSENIRVVSIVDRFLEHSRIFVFGPAGGEEVYLSSADWMPRNFLRRVEVMFPIEDPALKRRILDDVLGLAFRDTVKARVLLADGSYIRVPAGDPPLRSQVALMDLAREPAEPKPDTPLRVMPALSA